MSELAIDVIIPAHDAAATIGDAVGAASAQSLKPQQIIVVADACRDDTAAVAARAGADVLEVDHRSPARARNEGIRAARAAYVAFLDADDRWDPGWLAAAAEAVERAPAAPLWFGGYREIDVDGASLLRAPPAEEVDHDELLLGNVVGTSATLVPRALLLDVGLFEPTLRIAEDWDLWLRLATRGALVPVAGCHMQKRRVPTSLSRSPAELLRSRDDALRVVDRACRREPVPRPLRRRAQARVLGLSAMRLLAHDHPRAARIDLEAALHLAPDELRLWLLALGTALPAELVQLAIRTRRAWQRRAGGWP